MKTYRLITTIIIFVLVLSACNMPASQPTQQVTNPNAVFTAAAETVVAQLTQNALLVPTNLPAATIAPPSSTSTPGITNTPLPVTILSTATPAPVAAPTTTCDAAKFEGDITIPDGTIFNAGDPFVKTWQLKNIGTCTWNSSYALVYDSGDAMAGPTSQALTGNVTPGSSVNVSVNLQAPAADGTYRGYWGITNPSGQRVSIAGGNNGRSFYVEIKVGSGSGDSSGKFAVTSVGFSLDKSACASLQYTITATIVANKAGDMTYTWILSDGTSGPSGSITFDQAGSKAVNYSATFASGVQWVDLYVDKPNHQQFGRATFACP